MSSSVPVFPAIVAGGGISGLTAAAYLAREGIPLLLLEKNDQTGGLVNSFSYEGFVFDGGVRALVNSGMLFPMLRSLGIELRFRPNPIRIGIGEEQCLLDGRDRIADYCAMLGRIFPESLEDISLIEEQLCTITACLDVIYGIDNPLFEENLKDLGYLKGTLLPWLKDYRKSMKAVKKLTVPVKAYLGRFTRNTALIDMIAQHFFEKTPAFFALSYFGLYADYHYPEGGTGSLSQALERYIIEKGGRILCGSEIIGADPEAHTLVLADGSRFGWEQLIWAADQSSFYRLADGLRGKKQRRMQALTQEARAADSVLTLFLGLDIPKENFETFPGPHAFWTPSPEGLRSIRRPKSWEGAGLEELYAYLSAFLERTTYEISCPSLRDKELAPEGQSGLEISTLMDYGLCLRFRELGAYEAMKDFCRRRITEVFEQGLIPALGAKTLCSLLSTPLSLEERFGNKQGGLSGWSFANEKIPAVHEFSKIQKSIRHPIPDVWQCGQWTFSPAGVPTCLLSGKLAADAVKKKLG